MIMSNYRRSTGRPEINMKNTEKKAFRRLFVSIVVVFVAIVAGLGVAWVKSLPKLIVSSDGRVEIINCEPPLPTYAIGVCPKLYCKKQIMDSGRYPQQLQIGFTEAKPSADKVIYGSIRYLKTGKKVDSTDNFKCVLDGYEVDELKYLNKSTVQ